MTCFYFFSLLNLNPLNNFSVSGPLTVAMLMRSSADSTESMSKLKDLRARAVLSGSRSSLTYIYEHQQYQ